MNKQNNVLQHGFSLLELMVSMAILTIVIGVVAEGVNTMQVRNTVETSKVDLTQETREFMDQIVNDIRQAGYPRINLFDPATLISPGLANSCTSNNGVACGIMNISSTSLQFEGDVDGTGVSEVYINLVIPNSGNCPCTLQRGTVLKPGVNPPFYTEVNNVMNQNIFTAYNNIGAVISGLPINTGNAYNNSYDIEAIGVTLYVRASQPDAKTGLFPSVTMASTVKINNAGN